MIRCLFCRAALGEDVARVRRDLPPGSPCPHCGRTPLKIDWQDRDDDPPAPDPLPLPARQAMLSAFGVMGGASMGMYFYNRPKKT